MTKLLASLFLLLSLPAMAFASTTGSAEATHLDLTSSTLGILALVVFVLAYVFVLAEEFLHLCKSKPVIIAAGIIRALIGTAYYLEGDTSGAVAAGLRHNVQEFA